MLKREVMWVFFYSSIKSSVNNSRLFSSLNWGENGQLSSEIMMKKGKPSGKYIIYEDGVKSKEGIAKPPQDDTPSCSCC